MPPQKELIWPLPTQKGRLFQRRLSTPLTPFATLPVAFFAPRLYAPPYATDCDVLQVLMIDSQYAARVPQEQPMIENVKGCCVEEKLSTGMHVKEVQAKEAARVKETQSKKSSEYAD
ncbi:hypothetical protein LTR95_014699 [Oleoguttula sp. CCFEE 5521]